MRRYLAVPPPERGAGTRLLCFHHAGAGALSFARWQQRTGPGVRVLPVRLPGRETRLREQGITEGGVLVRELEDELGPLLDEPHAFYGHSLGALVAHRFALHRAAEGRRPPLSLMVGACSAPKLRSALLEGLDPERVTDSQLLRAMTQTEALPEPLMRRPAGLAVMLRALRTDLSLARSLRACAAEGPVVPLTCPIEAFAGREDRMVSVRDMWAWRDCTSSGFRLRTLPGAHFFVRDPELPQIVGELLNSQAPLLPTGG